MSAQMIVRSSAAALGAAALVSCTPDAVQPDRMPVEMVVILPATATVAVGANVPLMAEVRNGAGILLAGRRVHWSSEDPSVAVVSADGLVTARRVGTVQVAASIEGKSGLAEITVNPTPVATVRLSPTSLDLFVGSSAQILAEPLDPLGGPLSDRPVSWASNNASVATVSATGLVTALAPGGAIVTASSEGKTALASVTVAVVPVTSVVVAPDSAWIVVGQTAQLQAQPRDTSARPLPGRVVAWSTSSAQIATVTSTGVVTAVSPGSATITASSEGRHGSAAITVGLKPVNAVIVSPSQLSVVAGGTAQLTAQVTDDQGVVLAGRPVSYASANAQVATVSASGLVTGVTPGSAAITVTSEGKSGTAAVIVTPIPVATVVVSPAAPNVIAGQTVNLAAEARSAGGQVLAGRQVSWSSGAPAVATVSATGTVTGVTPGSAVIFASIDGVLGSVTVSVRPVPVATVTVSPSTAALAAGLTLQLTATLRDANANPLTGRVVGWSSSNASVASVSSSGFVTAVTPGSTTITATSEGRTGTAAITVAAPPASPVASVTVAPASLPLQLGATGVLTATARDASNNVLAGRAMVWSSSNVSVATVAPNGTVTAVAAGGATVTATSEGKSGTASVTVTAPPPATPTLTVTPASATVNVFGTTKLTATARNASGNVVPGASVTWSTSNGLVANVAQDGTVSGLLPGTATITATWGSVTGTATVTVQF